MTDSAHLSNELAGILAEIGGSRFGHRQHIQLAFIAARQGGDPSGRLCEWIKQIAASHDAPDKYHETITIAWAKIVAHHVAPEARKTSTAPEARQTSTPPEARRHTSTARAVTDFEAFVERYPALLDKTLLTRHYSPAVLGSPAARDHWVPPDLVPLPS